MLAARGFASGCAPDGSCTLGCRLSVRPLARARGSAALAVLEAAQGSQGACSCGCRGAERSPRAVRRLGAAEREAGASPLGGARGTCACPLLSLWLQADVRAFVARARNSAACWRRRGCVSSRRRIAPLSWRNCVATWRRQRACHQGTLRFCPQGPTDVLRCLLRGFTGPCVRRLRFGRCRSRRRGRWAARSRCWRVDNRSGCYRLPRATWSSKCGHWRTCPAFGRSLRALTCKHQPKWCGAR